MKISCFLSELRDLPKTIYLNIKVFNLKYAIKLPIRIKYNVKIGKLTRGSFVIDFQPSKYCIKLGYNGASFISENHSYLSVEKGGTITFKGKCMLGEGFNIFVNGGNVVFGDNMYANRNFQLQAEKEIVMGNNVLMGWNTKIRDTDGHATYYQGVEKAYINPIKIGNHVWLASDSTILKGTNISDGSIVGCGSIVCGLNSSIQNSLIVGVPAKVKKTNVSWEE